MMSFPIAMSFPVAGDPSAEGAPELKPWAQAQGSRVRSFSKAPKGAEDRLAMVSDTYRAHRIRHVSARLTTTAEQLCLEEGLRQFAQDIEYF
jgi:hypothetical protein